MDEFAAQKKECRRAARAAASSFWPDNRDRISAGMAVQVLSLPEYRSAETVFCFVGTELEPDTEPVLSDAFAAGKTVCVPLTFPDRIEARAIRSLNDLRMTGAYGIREPGPECPLIRPDGIDLCLVPCLCCDRNGGRLGHGKGYYDRFLAGYRGEWVVLCASALLTARVPMDVYDLRAPAVVTEKSVLRFSGPSGSAPAN